MMARLSFSLMSMPMPLPLPSSGVLTPSRRQLLQAGLSLGAACALPQAVHAQSGPAFVVTPWTGPVPAFSVVDTSGKVWRPADLKGRAVLLNFWASWCEPCRAEMPTLQQVGDVYGPDKLLVLAINFKEPAMRALRFATTTGVSLPILLDLDGAVAKSTGVRVFPTTLTIDARGRPRDRVQGEVDWTGAEAEKLIAKLLKD